MRGAAVAGGAFLAACTRATRPFSPGWAAPIPMGTAPDPLDAAVFDTATPIKRVVYIVKENRTFDHLFGRFPGANGVTVGMDHGLPRPLTPATRGAIPQDIQHCYECAIEAWNEGRMDGFNRDAASDRDAYTQFTPSDLPSYGSWAERFVLLDNFFTSAHGPSFPNHLFTIAAQSGGAYENPVQDRAALRRRHRSTGLWKAWGCDSLDNAFVGVKDAEGTVGRAFPCFEFETAGDLLDRKRIPWACYSATPYQNGYIWNAYSAISHVRGDPERWAQHCFPVDDVVRHIPEDRLPPVTWITPRFEVSDHPEYRLCWGETWSTKVVDAIMESPMWPETAVFLTWDDYGGFYDHEPPPQIDALGLGIRAPMLVISPFAKDGHVSHGSASSPQSCASSRTTGVCRSSPSATGSPRRCTTRSISSSVRGHPTLDRCRATAKARYSRTSRPEPDHRAGQSPVMGIPGIVARPREPRVVPYGQSCR